jgi:hypothetical protein
MRSLFFQLRRYLFVYFRFIIRIWNGTDFSKKAVLLAAWTGIKEKNVGWTGTCAVAKIQSPQAIDYHRGVFCAVQGTAIFKFSVFLFMRLPMMCFLELVRYRCWWRI